MPPRKRTATAGQGSSKRAAARTAKAPSPSIDDDDLDDDQFEMIQRLALCARRGDVDGVKELLSVVVDDKHVALFMACECGKKVACSAIIQASVDAGANLEAMTPDGETPLMRAVKKRNDAAVKALLEAGADLTRTDTRGQTALDSAKQKLREAKTTPEAAIVRLLTTSAAMSKTAKKRTKK
jgi:ankyrin repeat protein